MRSKRTKPFPENSSQFLNYQTMQKCLSAGAFFHPFLFLIFYFSISIFYWFSISIFYVFFYFYYFLITEILEDAAVPVCRILSSFYSFSFLRIVILSIFYVCTPTNVNLSIVTFCLLLLSKMISICDTGVLCPPNEESMQRYLII